MGSPCRKHILQAALQLSHNALADAGQYTSASIYKWGRKREWNLTRREVQAALTIMYRSGQVSRDRYHDGFLYRLKGSKNVNLEACAHEGEDCDEPDHCPCFCASCLDDFEEYSEGDR